MHCLGTGCMVPSRERKLFRSCSPRPLAASCVSRGHVRAAASAPTVRARSVGCIDPDCADRACRPRCGLLLHPRALLRGVERLRSLARWPRSERARPLADSRQHPITSAESTPWPRQSARSPCSVLPAASVRWSRFSVELTSRRSAPVPAPQAEPAHHRAVAVRPITRCCTDA